MVKFKKKNMNECYLMAWGYIGRTLSETVGIGSSTVGARPQIWAPRFRGDIQNPEQNLEAILAKD